MQSLPKSVRNTLFKFEMIEIAHTNRIALPLHWPLRYSPILPVCPTLSGNKPGTL